MIIKTQLNRYTFRTFALVCVVLLVVSSTATAQNSSIEFPYQALVSKDNALVRSGPGKVHYGTQKLPAGEVVEVYRHDPDGWCAIRPVEGSFCIIPESTVEIVSEGVGEIKLAGTTPFVGTKLGSVEKPLWQVKLREKEKVALIGQLSWPSPEGHSTVWYQIKPPAGEFRWIHVSNLESLSGETMASVIAPKPAIQTFVAAPKAPVPFRLPAGQSASAVQPSASAIQSPAVAVEPAAVGRTTVVPDQPSVDLATARQPVVQRPIANTVPPRSQPLAQPDRNNFAADVSRVELASFAPAPTPTRLPEPAAPAVEPPLQDSGGGWRKATRSMPSDSSLASSSAGFNSRSASQVSRNPFNSSVGNSNYSSGNNSSGIDSNKYSNSGFTNQQAYNTSTSSSNSNSAYQPYDLNSVRQTQQSYSGQVRFADASPDRSRFAQQINRSGIFESTYTGQPATGNALQTLNNRLTVEMLKAPSLWQLAPLEAATRQYMTTADYGQQQAAQQFLAKLANCRQVAAGYGGGAGASFATGTGTGGGFSNGQQNVGVGSGSRFAGSPTNRNNFTSNAQFDATGWLNELKQGRGTDPSTYVLQDETGKIIYHVSPMPGINLNRYLKKRVGVNGQLGFNQRLNLKHVTIERVFPL